MRQAVTLARACRLINHGPTVLGESSPTAVVLERLATGLGVAMASLFDTPTPRPSPLARAKEQPPWRDPQSGYVRRNVSPSGAGSPIQIVEVHFPAGARVAYETGPREPRVHQQVWVQERRDRDHRRRRAASFAGG